MLRTLHVSTEDVIVTNMRQVEIGKECLGSIVLRRRSKKGVNPGPTTAEVFKRRNIDKEGEETEIESKWSKVRRELTKEEKRRLLGKAV